jgi:competence protein ComEA
VPDLSRTQLAVYGAIGVALLLIGARSIAAESEGSPLGGGGGGEAVSDLRFSDGGGEVVVHVAGAVRQPGVYRLPGGTRVTDAVKRAGGAAPRAALDAVNLAARLADGQQVVIPEAGPGGQPVSGSGTADGPISLGTATVPDLDTIEGIGPVTAQDIVDFRDQHGGLASIEQLDQISGIGPATMEALRDRLQP